MKNSFIFFVAKTLTAVQKYAILYGNGGSHARDKINHPPAQKTA
jgi:hypothetical protein